MVSRYFEIKPFLEEVSEAQPILAPLLLSTGEELKLKNLHANLSDFNSVTLLLQSRDMSYAKCRYIFDELMKKYPDMNKYISSDSNIVNSPTFETAIFKIVSAREKELTEEEENEVKSLLLVRESPSEVTIGTKSFADSLLTNFEMDVESNCSKYINCNFILPGTIIVESLFSMVGYMFDDRRMSTTPPHIEEQVFLKVNRNLWDEKTFFKILEKEKK